MFTFAKFAQLVMLASKQNSEDTINNLLGCIYRPLNLRNKTGDTYYIDKSTSSYLLNGKRDVMLDIQQSSGAERVTEGAKQYFLENVVNLMLPQLIDDFLENIKKHITTDNTISAIKKEELLRTANKDTLDIFLANVCLYVVNKPNNESIEITAPNNLPEQNKYFSGRIDQLNTIDELLKNTKNEAINICQTVSGLGGIGKTQLSVEYAYRYGYRYKNCIWFITADNSTNVYNCFYDFAVQFKLVLPENFKPEDLQIAVKDWLINNKGWLLIFDNLEIFDDIRCYLPDRIHGRIIITTRNKRLDFGRPLELDVFEQKEAIDFLKKRFSNDDNLKMERYIFKDFEINAVKLVERLGCLPLALEQAAAYIREVKCSIAHYLDLLNESGTDAFSDKLAMPKYYESIVTKTWSISFSALEESAKQLMNLCAYMAPDKIPVDLFVATREKLPMPLSKDLSTKLSTYRIVTALRTYSLATGNSEFIDIHRLVQEVVRKSHSAKSN